MASYQLIETTSFWGWETLDNYTPDIKMKRHNVATAEVALGAQKGKSSTENNWFSRGPNIFFLALQMWATVWSFTGHIVLTL